MAEIHNEEWERSIVHRFQQASKFITVEAEYHNKCMKNLHVELSSHKNKSHPAATNVAEVRKKSYHEDNFKTINGLN